MPVTPDHQATVKTAVSGIAAAKDALKAALEPVAAEMQEGEIRALEGPVAVVTKRDGVAKIETLKGLVG